MKFKKIIISALILLIIGLFVAYKMYNKPHVNVADEKATVSLSAAKLLQDFSTDEATANADYLEKIIQVKGIVAEAKVENNKGIVTLETGDDFATILCHLTVEETKNINTIKVGQNISLKGICTGFLMDVVLVKCVITN
ncbi:hypothetical protein [uncultured Polaribacter sp.]|uniref:OB-fold protein n=1 Tax=uncultured Polaribacter sp. TaxID=174711 RepID=UPI002632BD45|nr:hypothetical protein [uncultured Polaribacter sp.]